MKTALPHLVAGKTKTTDADQGQARVVILTLISFLLGLGVGIYWVYKGARPAVVGEPPQSAPVGQSVALSDATRKLLQNLSSPVEVRYYIKKDLKQLPETLRTFIERADRLVAEFEHAGGSKLRVTRHDPMLDAPARATAKSDGIQPIEVGSGELCYLGLVFVCGERKEILAQLSPDWETALESDVSRCLARVTTPTTTHNLAAQALAIDPAVTEEVSRAFPDLPVVSLEEGTQILREATMEQFKTAVEEMQARVREAEQKAAQLQNSGSELEKEAARKQLQKIQSEQTTKLKEITQRLQDQIAAWERLKAQNNSTRAGK